MMRMPIPNPVDIDISSANITGVKTHRINIFDAWRDHGVIITKPLAKYTPPRSIDELIKVGIAKSLTEQTEKVKQELNNTQQSLSISEINRRLSERGPINNTLFPAGPYVRTGALMSINSGGAMLSWGDIANWFGSVANAAENAGGTIAGAAGNAAGAIWSGLQQTGQTISNFAGDIGKVWNSLVHLADLVNEMYEFMKQWKDMSSTINNKLLNLSATNKALTDAANRLILENRQVFANIEKAMHESLAKYFDDLVYNLIKYGQVDVPTAVVGTIGVQIKNKSAMPMTVTIPDLTIRSGPYLIHKGLYVVNMLPFEGDHGEIPFEVHDVEVAKYLLDSKKKGGNIPVTVTGKMVTPVGEYNLNISKVIPI